MNILQNHHLIFTLFLITSPLPALSFSFSTYQTLFSISHSLISRVASLRESRGNFSGSDRARAIAKTLERGSGFGFRRFMWSVGWDYFRNLAWRDMQTFELAGALSDMNELMRGLNELTRVDKTEERMAWVPNNYSKVLENSKSLFGRLIKILRQSRRRTWARPAVRRCPEMETRPEMEGMGRRRRSGRRRQLWVWSTAVVGVGGKKKRKADGDVIGGEGGTAGVCVVVLVWLSPE